MYKKKSSTKVRKLNCSINLEIRRSNSMITQKLLSCKNSPSMCKLFKELTGERDIRNENQLNVCDVNNSFVRQLLDIMLP